MSGQAQDGDFFLEWSASTEARGGRLFLFLSREKGKVINVVFW